MATRPELHIAVAKQKSKASEYNDNFDMMLDYIDDSIQESKDYVDGFMPDVTGQSGKFLTNNGTSTSWASIFSGNQTFTGNNTFSGTNSFTGNVTISGSSFNFTKCTTKATTTSTASNSKVAVIVQNYKNGNSWYRVWSDGWIEQGGAVSTTNNGEKSVSLIKTMTTTNYFVTAQTTGSRINNVTYLNSYTIVSRTTSGFTLYVGYTDDRTTLWYACGY